LGEGSIVTFAHVPISHPDGRKRVSAFDGDNNVGSDGFDLKVFEYAARLMD